VKTYIVRKQRKRIAFPGSLSGFGILQHFGMSFLIDCQCHEYVIFAFKIMTAYKQFITAVGKLLGGDDEMKTRAEEIVAFETKLAKVTTL